MSNALSETQFRGIAFERSETHVAAQGEIDVFSSNMPDGPKILIHLKAPAGDQAGDLFFANMTVIDQQNEPLRLIDEDGAHLDDEMVEIVAWEIIEADDLVTGYMGGRARAMREDGTLHPEGSIVHQSGKQPDFEMSGP